MTLPKAYAWLADEPSPRILRAALELYGVKEQPGPGNNPTILSWAKAVGLSKVYTSDEIPWCGLGMAYIALQGGWEPPVNPLWARNWLTWGTAVAAPQLGDVLVFARGKAGHVGIYVGEDADAYHVLGCNQDDQVKFKRIPKSRLLGARRCPWRVNQPGNVRRVQLAATGALSTNEA